MNLFGKKKAAPAPVAVAAPAAAPRIIDTITMLRNVQQSLEKREVHLLKQITAAREEAKQKLIVKDRRGALHLMKRSKLLENEVEKVYGKKNNLDVQIFALEGAASNREILNGMRQGKDALKAATLPHDVENVQDVMDDINEAIALADELGDALSAPIGNSLMDDDELSAELAEMEKEMHEQELEESMAVPVQAPAARQQLPQQQQQQQTQQTSSSAIPTQQQQQTAAINNLPVPRTTIKPPTSTKTAAQLAEEQELKDLQAMMAS